MALTLKVYSDAGLTSELKKLNVLQRSDGVTGPVDAVFYLGSTETNKKFEASSDPGVDDIVISVVDSDTGAGQASTAVKLSFTAAGLDTAIAGDPLTVGSQILSEVANAVEVHARIEATNFTEGTYTDLSINTNNLVESTNA